MILHPYCYRGNLNKPLCFEIFLIQVDVKLVDQPQYGHDHIDQAKG
jgi:hypothetical protein